MADKSPLELYKEIVTEFKITDEEMPSPVQKLTFIQSQLSEQKAILNRLIFDLSTANFQKQAAKDQLSIDAFRKKADNFRNDIYQILDAIRVNNKLITELREEYEELQVQA